MEYKLKEEERGFMKKKSRSECFFGLHFDFHAMEGEEIGKIIDIESITKMLDETKPDMIQVDSKGHPGISSYMTKAGKHAPVMHMDVLREWRKLTEERGIRLYAHHSGLFDQTQARLHPEWAVVSAQGEVSRDYLSPFSNYVDEVLIPQMLEMAGEYGVDGVWVDGEAWGAFVDYSENAQAAWRNEMNEKVPYPGEDEYEEYREFCREGFRRYVRHYVEAVKAQYPTFEITSNWIYSQLMPEKRTIPVDFLSGDYNTGNSVKSARAVGLCLGQRNITWDLMAWGQNAKSESWLTRDRCTKEATQLCQEASVVLSQGGGFQFFNILYGTGGLVQEWAIPGWTEIARFCRKREKYCFHAKSLSDIGVVFPEYYEKKSLFEAGAWENVKSWVHMIKDVGYSCDVVYEAEFEGLEKYKVLVLPCADCYRQETVDKVKEFVQNGGTVLADGGVELGEAISGVKFKDKQKKLIFLDGGEGVSALETDYYTPLLTDASEFLYCYEQNYYYEPERHISAVINQLSKGHVVSLCFALSPVYGYNITYILKQYVKSLFGNYKPFANVEGSDYADVTIMQKDNKIMVNIINMAGEHNAYGVRTFREIPSIGPLHIRIRTAAEPKEVYFQPEGRKLELVDSADGYCYLIGTLKIHGVVEITL